MNAWCWPKRPGYYLICRADGDAPVLFRLEKRELFCAGCWGFSRETMRWLGYRGVPVRLEVVA